VKRTALVSRPPRPPRPRTFTTVALSLALLLTTASVAAQEREQDAERLFREGQKLLEERRFGEACPKFEAAYAKDHSLGTLINLAFCHKEQGATWYAWLEFREAEVKATELNRADRRDFAHQRLAELEKQLPKLIVDNPKSLPLTDVLVEDRKVWEAERGAVFAAEVGERRFTFKARGKKPTATLITVAKGDKVQHVVVPDMEDGAEAAPAKERPPEPAKPETASGTNSGSMQRTLGWVALGVGGVAALIGAIEGVSTFSSPCHSGKACTSDERDAANGTATIADVSFVVALLAGGGGVYLLLTAPPASQNAAPAATSARVALPSRASSVSVTPHLGLGWASLTGTF
jgi:hypothetical protein